MATYLLDTSIIIDALNGRSHRAQQLENLLESGNLLACCSINVTEVYSGLRPKEEVKKKAFLGSLDYLEVNWEIARAAGLFRRDYARKGVTLTVADCTLAAAAIHHDCSFITDNMKDFPMKELNLHPLSKVV
jgi:predicted nucleic acid-binding protein